MKIGNPTDKPVAAPAPVTAGRPATTATPTPAGKTQTAATQEAGVEASTQVALSNAATELMAGEGVSGDFDTAKVERIAKAIAEGKFEVNAGAIADKLISNARELLGGPQQH
jgi:negative regulator of flagellin synthesis FlgM